MKIFVWLFVLNFSLVKISLGQQVFVKNAAELVAANKSAKPGDVIVLKNGVWNDVNMRLNCAGTKIKPITFKAETAGKVIISGQSSLKLGGAYIVVDGFYFTNGYAGDNSVIDFRVNNQQLANNCRVTNTVINDFNNPKRMDENYWISFYGKNNRIDHCSFLNKNNMGVLLAVILDDERSRENFHSIDHNYFGVRLPLASNSGEIIRAGVSQHCEFNSNTQITDNFFEHCDGETEIISMKSGSNVIRNNLFKECQGAVVLRHGNFNTVENNVFLGNNKIGTGGVRVINKGQWVINNFFYQCRGIGFRSPLSVMNGVPNSPAFRYVTASDAVIMNNSFYECTPLSFCEGADTERSEAPFNIHVLNNIIYNKKDSVTYQTYDVMNGFHFRGNLVQSNSSQKQLNGFSPASFSISKENGVYLPATTAAYQVSDSLIKASDGRISGRLSTNPGFKNANTLAAISSNAYKSTGAAWFKTGSLPQAKPAAIVKCSSAEEVLAQLGKNDRHDLTIDLTGTRYDFTTALNIRNNTTFTSAGKAAISFSNPNNGAYFIQLIAGNKLTLKNIKVDLSSVHTKAFITTDTSGSSKHSSIKLVDCSFEGFNGSFFNAAKSVVCDSIVIVNSIFKNNKGSLFRFMDETDKKGYYNVEQLLFRGNQFINQQGSVLSMLRGGNDESTLGPSVKFNDNTITDSRPENGESLISLYGTQQSVFSGNNFKNSHTTGIVLQFEDIVRARHILSNNKMINSGRIVENQFVERKEYTVKSK